MDHKTFLATLPEGTLARHTQRRDRPGLWRASVHFGLIAIIGALIAVRVPGWGVLLPVQGVLIVFLFTLEHECTHKTPFATPWVNEALGHVCGAVLVLPFLWFRYFHMAHHRFTNLPGQDPELAQMPPHTRAGFWWHVSGIPLWRDLIATLLRLAAGRAGESFVPVRARSRIIREARLLLGFYAVAAATFLFSPVLVWVWLVPLLLGQPVLRVYLLAEHGRCPQVANMFDNTRTTCTNRIVRLLAWNMPYHVEHHVAPVVPFHQLPAFHDLARDHLRHMEQGYVRFAAAHYRAL